MDHPRRPVGRVAAQRSAACGVLLLLCGVVHGEELAPRRVEDASATVSPARGLFSARSVRLGIEVSRHEARVVAYTLKPVPFVRELRIDEPRGHTESPQVQVEVALLGPGEMRYTQRADVGPLCLAHDPGFADHVNGDTIRLHRDAFVIEVPELAGYDRIEVAYFESDRGQPVRKVLVTEKLDPGGFTPAGGPLGYQDLAFAGPSGPGESKPSPAATVIWPEQRGDPDIYKVYGNEAESTSRINVTIVPDGYTYPEKAVMETHAEALIADFRAKTPYKEHDSFINYTLVYAYSRYSGTDECDCGIILDTAMGTRFPDAGDPCGGSANRCLYYGTSCDSSGTENIVAAELRAPAHDETIVMVNTTRYGGCGGARAVYSAGNGSATEIAVHELGHSLGGLADEYQGNPTCSAFAGEINTSSDPINGAWPEWIGDLGPPREGAQYYDQCRYRPTGNCEMRSLFQEFCPVCNQHWSLVLFGHPRIAPTAPISGATPVSPATAVVGEAVDFAVTTRFSTGPQITNSIEWSVDGPGFTEPTVLGSGPAFSHTFDTPGSFTVQASVIADTNFVKPSRYGANLDTAVFDVQANLPAAPLEVSPAGTAEPVLFTSKETLVWEDGAASGASTFNLYRGDLSGLDSGEYGTCLDSDLPANSATDSDVPASGVGWLYLITGANPGGEGPMGGNSASDPRPNGSPCN